jgi:ferredoxin
MRIVAYYFSGTGNTWWAARVLRDHLVAAGHSAAIHCIEDQMVWEPAHLREQIDGADFFGLLYPIYGSREPLLVEQFIAALVAARGETATPRKAFVITTMMLFSGDGGLVTRRRLRAAGLELVGATNIRVSSNVCIPGFRARPYLPEKVERLKIRGAKKIGCVVDRVLRGQKSLAGQNPFAFLLAYMQRAPFNQEYKRISRRLSVDPNTCVRCNLCASTCPTGNITQAEESYQFGDNCTLCMRCYNFCPTQAILMFGKQCPPARYPRYHGPEPSLRPGQFRSID